METYTIATLIGTSALALMLTSCESAKEEALEDKADIVRDQAEERADELEEKADVLREAE